MKEKNFRILGPEETVHAGDQFRRGPDEPWWNVSFIGQRVADVQKPDMQFRRFGSLPEPVYHATEGAG